jgi:hypothetical protein
MLAAMTWVKTGQLGIKIARSYWPAKPAQSHLLESVSGVFCIKVKTHETRH